MKIELHHILEKYFKPCHESSKIMFIDPVKIPNGFFFYYELAVCDVFDTMQLTLKHNNFTFTLLSATD